MNYRKQAEKLNRIIFDNMIDLSLVQFAEYREFVGAEGIAGITYAFKTEKGIRISVVTMLTKYCKEKHFTKCVLAHELVHVLQNQLKLPLNHNGALMKHYCRKARALGYEIQMGRLH